MTKPTLTVDRLAQGGFKEAGCWELNSVSDLVHSIDLPRTAGVYVFLIDGVAQYVGLASKSLRQRLGFYRKPGVSQRTNIRLNEVIRGHLTKGTLVQIYVAQPPDAKWGEFVIKGPEGLEAGLIERFDLPWNMRGSIAAAPKLDRPKSEPKARESRMAFFVYDNWTIDKAIVHRAECSFCKGGSGLHGTGATKNSRWHGPFETASAALAKARNCKRARTDGCQSCSPL